MAGNGFHASILGLRARLEGFDTAVIGMVMASYYVGFLVGSLVTPRLLGGVGHVRAFSGLASLASAAVLIHVVYPTPVVWGLLRLLSGFCISGLYVVTETWLNRAATNTTRGQLLGVYMVVLTASVAGGQLLLNAADPGGFGAFVLASVLVSLAVVPVALVRVAAPEMIEPVRVSLAAVVRVAPLAVAGSAAAGATTGAVFALGAVYASETGLSLAQTSLLLASVLVAALLLQFPLGAISDRVDRRRVIAGVAFTAAGASVAAGAVSGPSSFAVLVPLVALAGGLGYPLYSLSNAHLNDYLTTGDVIAAGAKVVLVNGAGAVAGPLAASVALARVGAGGFFSVLAGVYGVTGLYALYRLTRRAPAPEDQRATFAPLPAGVAPTAVALASDPSGERTPAAEGEAEGVEGVALRWVERGSGEPIVLVHGTGTSADSWGDLPLFLAEDGHRVVAYDRRGHGRSGAGRSDGIAAHVADLESVLRDRNLPACHLVAARDGAVVAGVFAVEQPERVLSLVLVDASGAMEKAPVYAAAGLAAMADRTRWVDPADPGGDGERLDPTSDPALLADAIDDFVRSCATDPMTNA